VDAIAPEPTAAALNTSSAIASFNMRGHYHALGTCAIGLGKVYVKCRAYEA